MEEKVFNAALAGLIYDIGVFSKRARVESKSEDHPGNMKYSGAFASLVDEFIDSFIPDGFRKGLKSLLVHQNDITEGNIPGKISGWLSIGKPDNENGSNAPEKTSLVPILSRVSLSKPVPPATFRYRLAPLSLNNEILYPVSESEALKNDYPRYWAEFTGELLAWKQSLGDKWEKQSPDVFFVTLLSIFRKYLWCVPASISDRESEKQPILVDVPLYDHLRLTSAIAACLAFNESKKDWIENRPVALILRGDFSGIQNFIFRITRPEAETVHVAKRLRGRSFYLTLLASVVINWILRLVGLPLNCAIFEGGGRFDLILPLEAEELIPEIQKKINSWLLAQFHGELGIQLAFSHVSPKDLTDLRQVYQVLDTQLEEKKLRKWGDFLGDEHFFEPGERLWHVCKVCRLTPLNDPGICPICVQHEQIGKNIPHSTHILFFDAGMEIDLPKDQIIEFQGSPFGLSVGLIREEDSIASIADLQGIQVVYKLNDANDFIWNNYSSSFRFLANTAPRAKHDLYSADGNNLSEGDVLHFEMIAELSRGARRIGILKADVDHLGLVMSEGLDQEHQPIGATITRLATLSSALDMFFGGLLNQICNEAYDEWNVTTENPRKNDVDGSFYIMYSGGDDLFIVGPWEQTLLLAGRINNAFCRFCGDNPNLTISAGFVQVKPRYPTQKFAELVNQAEGAAKNSGRNKISAFNQVLNWKGAADSYQELNLFAEELMIEISTGNIPRGLIIDLSEIFRHKNQPGKNKSKALWTPRLYYTLARRLKKETYQRFGTRIIQTMNDGKVLYPVSIISLATRKE